jgi:hypothetical protein
LTGKEPFPGYDLEQVKSAVLTNQLRPAFDSKTHPDLSKLIKECWDSNPKARPSYAKIIDVLESISP